MIEQVGAFLDQLGAVVGHGGDHRFGRFLTQLLGGLLDAAGNELGCIAFVGRGSGALGDYLAGLINKGIKPAGGKKLRVRADTFGYLQRSFAGFVSEVDAAEARVVGRRAVEFSAKSDNVQGSVAMLRTGDGKDYGVRTELVDLKDVARVAKHMPDEHLAADHNVTEAWLTYVRPLVGRLPVVGTFEEIH